MKTSFTLLIAIFISMASIAAPVQTKLSVTVVGNKDIQIMVDNSRYQNDDQSTVITNLQPGSHTIKVYTTRKNQKRNIWGKSNNAQLIYSSTVYIRPGYFVDIMINRFGKALVDERAISDNNLEDDWQNDNYNGSGKPYNDRDEYNRSPVSEQSFASMVQTLRREYSENSRLVLAKQVIDRNYFSTEQVKYLLQLFSFENNKLELAKYAYRNTTDQRNYFAVYDVLTYSSSKEQLAEYIRRYR